MKEAMTWVLFALCLGLSWGYTQATWTVQTLIPETISLRVPTSEIAFGLSAENFPPDSFPAQYPASNLEGGVLDVEVYANTAAGWQLMLEVPDLLSEDGERLIPAEQVMYRINGGLWLRASGVPQVIHSSNYATAGWQGFDIEFSLELRGNEPAGSYVVRAFVTAEQE